MAKTLISRLDAENIVRAAVDPETHEATGDVYDSVNDISYPFGGGGGEAPLTLTVTFTVDEEYSNLIDIASVVTDPNTYEDRAIKYDADTKILSSGTTFVALYKYDSDNLLHTIDFDETFLESADIQASNAVNAGYEDGAVFVIDATSSSSITLKLVPTMS